MTNFEDVESRVKKALENFLESESYLLKNDVNERSITHKFAEYLKQQFTDLDVDVDCEYNKRYKNGQLITKFYEENREDIKPNDTHAHTIYPDIIIHNRDDKENNLLIIEAKKDSNPDSGSDKDDKKLKFYLEQFQYEFGLFIKFNVNKRYRDPPTGVWYPSGKKF